MVVTVPDTFQLIVSYLGLNQLKLIFHSIVNTSEVFVVIPSEAVEASGGNFIPAKTQLSTIPDTTVPLLVSWNLKINEEIVTMTFTEPMSEVVSLEQTFITNSTEPPFIIKYNLTNSSTSLDGDALVVTIKLTAETISALNSDTFTATSYNDTILVLGTFSFSDINTNPIAIETPLQVATFTGDSLPSVESFQVDLSSGSITITFSEPMQISSFQPSGLSLLNTESVAINLTNEDVPSVGFSDLNQVVKITLSYQSLNQLKLNAELPLGIFMAVDSSTAQDMSGNAVQNISSNNPLPVSVVSEDEISPLLVSITTGTPPNYSLTFVFNEYIQFYSFDQNSFSVIFVSPSTGSNAYNSFNGVETTSMLDAITYKFSRNYSAGDFGILYQIAFYSGKIYINISSDLVRDLNENTLLPPLEPVILESNTSDPDSPSLDSFTLNLAISILQLNFSEPIFVLNPVHRITLVNSDTSATNSYALNDSSYAELERTNGQSIDITLAPLDVVSLLAMNDLATEVTNTYITISMDFGIDFSGNSLINTEALQALCVNVCNSTNEGSGDGDVHCVDEVDTKWKLQWNKTNTEMTASQNCPPGFTGTCKHLMNKIIMFCYRTCYSEML